VWPAHLEVGLFHVVRVCLNSLVFRNLPRVGKFPAPSAGEQVKLTQTVLRVTPTVIFAWKRWYFGCGSGIDCLAVNIKRTDLSFIR
jgi:hypothetical protein